MYFSDFIGLCYNYVCFSNQDDIFISLSIAKCKVQMNSKSRKKNEF